MSEISKIEISGKIRTKEEYSFKIYNSEALLPKSLKDCTPEAELFLQAIGAYYDSETGEIHVTWWTQVDAYSRIDWSFNDDPTDFSSTEYDNILKNEHDVVFPEVFLGSKHYFRIHSKSLLGQEVESRYLGIICVPPNVEIITELFTEADIVVTSPKLIEEETSNLATSITIGPKSGAELTFFTELYQSDIITPKLINQENNNNIYTNIVIT